MTKRDKLIIWVCRRNLFPENQIKKKSFWVLWGAGMLVWIVGILLKYFLDCNRLPSEIIFWAIMIYLNCLTLISLYKEKIIKKTRKKYLDELLGNNPHVKVVCSFKDDKLKINETYEIDNISYGLNRYPIIELQNHDSIKLDSYKSSVVFKLVSLKESRKLKLEHLQ